mmetsp:Transcript_9918/g.11349  ORF Transcript_9918/g.11349 Transcript_9918/m.11349 type:complete len:252 (+) Transcript_9918:160-915(+)|eukprot:CAMPEP_0184021348 /NCGR_PEP_ID=MMETSP0954-20121128/9877_1 /TAXON_ID=627963 /ORGANISM="Aplanochytrium sp, Strain PBS07" /LENGTH=251 /DNA_ID=CAMNT_0026303355 /DNA_START=124 /DNA_END=879 /DNA_ORIENTATION=-
MVAAKKKSGKTTPSKEISSFKVFKLFIKYDKENNCDASGIVSKECFQKWKESRKKAPKNAQEAFRRALTAHIRGVDGRRPFPEEVESSLLVEVRKKKVWNCFEGCEGCFIGVQGFPSLGFHESKRNAVKVASARTSFIAEKRNSRKRVHEDSIWNMKPIHEDEEDHFIHTNAQIEDDFFPMVTRRCSLYDSKLPPLDPFMDTMSSKRTRFDDQLSPRSKRRLSAFLASRVYGESPLLEFDSLNEIFELPCF